jgi:hypothetical protein
VAGVACGRAWEARLFISREGEKGKKKKRLEKRGKGIKEWDDGDIIFEIERLLM